MPIRTQSSGTAPRVTAYLDWRHNIQYLGGLLSGLVQLDDVGRIILRFRPESERLEFRCSTTMRLDVEWGGHADRLTIDLSDDSAMIEESAVECSNVYFKRSCRFENYAGRGKIQPYGLIYSTRSKKLAKRLALHYAKLLPRYKLSMWGFHRAVAKQFIFSPEPSAYEAKPYFRKRPAVFFQPRLWDRESVPPSQDWQELNASRAALVRALRKWLGSSFVGGLVPNEISRRQYPDLVTTAPTTRAEFIAESKRHLVAVCTEGLYGTAGFGLAEAVAASRCIVTDQVSVDLPGELIEGMNILTYRSVDQAVEHCARLLDDVNLSGKMCAANADYYRRFIDPVEAAWRVISFCERARSGSIPEQISALSVNVSEKKKAHEPAY